MYFFSGLFLDFLRKTTLALQQEYTLSGHTQHPDSERQVVTHTKGGVGVEPTTLGAA